MSNTLATAAAVPFAGAISDLLGRRYVALLGAGLVIIGSIIVGVAQRVEVAIGGMAIVGVGAGLAEVVAAAAVAEMAPVKSRGKYMGTAFLFILPFGGSSTYGFTSCETSDISSIVFSEFDLEMGSLDLGYSCRDQLRLCLSLLSSSPSNQFCQPYSRRSYCSN
jgi:MFS family permease